MRSVYYLMCWKEGKCSFCHTTCLQQEKLWAFLNRSNHLMTHCRTHTCTEQRLLILSVVYLISFCNICTSFIPCLNVCHSRAENAVLSVNLKNLPNIPYAVRKLYCTRRGMILLDTWNEVKARYEFLFGVTLLRCDASSPHIHPVGWCQDHGRPLTAPQGRYQARFRPSFVFPVLYVFKRLLHIHIHKDSRNYPSVLEWYHHFTCLLSWTCSCTSRLKFITSVFIVIKFSLKRQINVLLLLVCN